MTFNYDSITEWSVGYKVSDTTIRGSTNIVFNRRNSIFLLTGEQNLNLAISYIFP